MNKTFKVEPAPTANAAAGMIASISSKVTAGANAAKSAGANAAGANAAGANAAGANAAGANAAGANAAGANAAGANAAGANAAGAKAAGSNAVGANAAGRDIVTRGGGVIGVGNGVGGVGIGSCGGDEGGGGEQRVVVAHRSKMGMALPTMKRQTSKSELFSEFKKVLKHPMPAKEFMKLRKMAFSDSHKFISIVLASVKV